jgi:tetratricopeptide (TPR) repeat protein
MKALRIIGLIAIVLVAAWFAWRSWRPPTPAPVQTPPPAREVFHVAKALRVEVQRRNDSGQLVADQGWLLREIRHVLVRGKMKVAPLPDAHVESASPNQAQPPGTDARPFTLRITIDDASHANAQLALIAPDRIEERAESVPIDRESTLAMIRGLAERLPHFLSAPTAATDWSASLGTNDPVAYETFLRASDEVLAPNAVGFTAPPPPAPDAVLNLERIETLARRHRDFARARALLSISYLSVGGEDQASLTKLAETAAERALTTDPQLADAHAALGIVRLRRMDWAAAHEHFDAALAIDASSLPALEGLACLLMDTGHSKESLAIATRIANLQPGNRGARQCASYALIAQQAQTLPANDQPFDVAKIYGTTLLLAGDQANAETQLKGDAMQLSGLVDSVIAASAARERIPEALQAITRAADDEEIDTETELLFGTALRRPDFVFNRMLRLAKQNEAVPLRMLWLPQTEFLRRHRRFREVVSAATLTTYWQDHGVPDVCIAEPKVHGCAVKPK